MLTLLVMQEALSICRLPTGSPIPSWATSGAFYSITCTVDELSIVCESRLVPSPVESELTPQVEPGWRGLKVLGPLDFSLTGILAGLAHVLAEAGISLFALSTFDTDYLLVREGDLESSLRVLRCAGYKVQL